MRNPMGSDPKKVAELKKAFDDAQAEAQKFVIPNQFTEVAERNGAHDLNAQTGLDETMYFWSMPENRLELWAWLESSRLADTVPREFYKERVGGAGRAPHAHRLQSRGPAASSSWWPPLTWRTTMAAAALAGRAS